MQRGNRRTCAALATVLVSLAAGGLAKSAWGGTRSEAYIGDPFGVGCIEVELPASEEPEPLGWRALGIDERRHRVLYPAVESSALAGAVKDVLRDWRRPAARLLGELIDGGSKAKIYFLFLGREPLEITIQARLAHAVGVTPQDDRAGFRRLSDAWWRRYTTGPGLLQASSDDVALVENYLRAMLASRLGLKLAEPSGGRSWQEDVAREVSLMANSESLRLEVERQRFLQAPGAVESADQPLPEAIASPPTAVPEPAPGVAVEPLAMRVPSEWLYVRFGSFTNFLWFQDTLERIGGDFQNLVASRGLDRGTRDRLEMQLATQTTWVSRLLGDAAIADVAIVGTDLFLQQGGAYGLLFQARSGALLHENFVQQRAQWKQKVPGPTETRVKNGEHAVSLLASLDGRVRSYYVDDGQYHLITTSEALARRFLEVRSGKGTLGDCPEFRFARSLLPLSRNDTVFVCLSAEFFGNLLSPQYRVEMMRRMGAMADIDLVQMAALAAAAEGKPFATIADLIAGGFLPPGFGPRPDGSRAVLEQGEVRDSLRGKRGLFVPIPDVPTTRVTRTEAAAYRHLADVYRSGWLRPLFVGIRRQPLDKDRDHVAIDLRTTPLANEQLDWASRILGPASQDRVAPIAEDAVALEIVLPRQRVVAGLQRIGSGVQIVAGMPLPLGRLRNLLVGYVGTSSEEDLRSWIPFRAAGLPDADGYARGQQGLWRRSVDSFTVFSFDREVLARVAPQLRLEKAPRAAQLRLHVSDLSKSPLASLANTWGYARTRETSLGNVRFLQQVIEQLHVPREAARTAAELLLGAKLVCPLGGRYVYRQNPGEIGFWTSTALEGTRPPGLLAPEAPDGYQAPPLNWFRGMDLEAALVDTGLSAHIELDMQWPAPRPDVATKGDAGKQ